MSANARNILGLAAVGVLGAAVLVLTPVLFDLDTVLNVTVYMIMAVLALSLALIWGLAASCVSASPLSSDWGRTHMRSP